MDSGILIIIALFLITEILNNLKHKEQIKKLQKQINELCKVTGNEKLMTANLTEEEKELVIHLKNTGKEVEAVKKIREFTGFDLVEAKKFYDDI